MKHAPPNCVVCYTLDCYKGISFSKPIIEHIAQSPFFSLFGLTCGNHFGSFELFFIFYFFYFFFGIGQIFYHFL